MKMVAAPSPNGTNRARVFIPASLCPTATAAYDAAPGGDPEPGRLTDEAIAKIVAMFEGLLEADDAALLEQLLRDPHSADPSPLAGDAPTPANPGMPEEYDDHLAGDDEGETSKFVRARLSAKDWKAFDAMRKKAHDARRARDAAGPPPFPGRPTPGGEPLRTAQDAHPRDAASRGRRERAAATAARSFAERFPAAARIRSW